MTPKKVLLITAICLTLALQLQANQDIDDISLESLLDVEISSAAKYEQKPGEAPSAVHIITQKEIIEHGYHTISDILNTLPGFYITDDRNYQYVGVRGFSRPSDFSNRVLLLIDGHKINENFYGSMDPGNLMGGINLRSFKRVEVIQGPGSVLYGAGAMFAVINLISNEGKDVDALQVGVELASHETYAGDITFGQQFDNGVQLHVTGIVSDRKGSDLYFPDYDDPETNDGLVVGVDGEKFHGIRLGLVMGEFKLHGLATSRTKYIPTAAWDIIFNDNRSWSIDNMSFLELEYGHDFSASSKLILRGFVDEYYYRGSYPYEDEEDGEVYDYVWLDKNVSLSYGFEGRFMYDANSRNRVILGIEWVDNPKVYYKEWDPWSIGFHGNFPYSALSAYAQQEYQITPKFAYVGGLRWDQYSHIGGMITPRLALVYDLSPTKTMKIISGLAFRAPTVYERFYEDADSGYLENTDLKEEQIQSHDLIYTDRVNKKIQLTINAFRYTISDLIDQVIEDASGEIIHVNADKVSSDGAEVKVQLIDKSTMQHYASYSFNYTSLVNRGGYLSNSPSMILKSGGHYRFSSVSTAGFDLRFETSRRTLYGEKTNNALITDLTLNHSFMHERLSLSLKVKNLFDVEYSHPGGWEHTMSSIQQDGRTIALRAQYAFLKGR